MMALPSIVRCLAAMLSLVLGATGLCAQTPAPAGMTQEQFDSLVDAIAKSVTDKLKVEGALGSPQDIAASVVGYIRHVALGQPLLAHRERVQAAMQIIMTSQPWTV